MEDAREREVRASRAVAVAALRARFDFFLPQQLDKCSHQSSVRDA